MVALKIFGLRGALAVRKGGVSTFLDPCGPLQLPLR